MHIRAPLRLSDIPSCGKGFLARWTSWGRDLRAAPPAPGSGGSDLLWIPSRGGGFVGGWASQDDQDRAENAESLR
eukprot:14984191-Alexandrium_andersonii.AAC.1